ncbi:hypothetical protein D3C76_1108260 [compost metagenome]
MLADLPDQIAAIGIRHPVFGFDGDIGGDLVVKVLLKLCVSCHACLLVIHVFHIKTKNVNHFN